MDFEEVRDLIYRKKEKKVYILREAKMMPLEQQMYVASHCGMDIQGLANRLWVLKFHDWLSYDARCLDFLSLSDLADLNDKDLDMALHSFAMDLFSFYFLAKGSQSQALQALVYEKRRWILGTRPASKVKGALENYKNIRVKFLMRPYSEELENKLQWYDLIFCTDKTEPDNHARISASSSLAFFTQNIQLYTGYSARDIHKYIKEALATALMNVYIKNFGEWT